MSMRSLIPLHSLYLIILFILPEENESKTLEQEETNSTAHSHRMLAWASVHSYFIISILAYRFLVSLDSEFFPRAVSPKRGSLYFSQSRSYSR